MNPDDWSADNSLFVFGSLMDTDVLEIVSGMAVTSLCISSSFASGFRQCEVEEESYPVLVPTDSAKVSGFSIQGLSTRAIKRILFFEGDEYRLEQIDVRRGDKHIEDTYFFRETGAYTVRNTMWDFQQWTALHKPSFVVACKLYMELYGKMSAAEADAHWLSLTRSEDGSGPGAYAVG